MVFPASGLPEAAARAPAAAMAEAELYYDDPSLPKQPKKAYTHLISTVPVPGAFVGVGAQTAISVGELACTGLAKQDDSSQLVASLAGRGLTTFESYVVVEFAAQYLCPKESRRNRPTCTRRSSPAPDGPPTAATSTSPQPDPTGLVAVLPSRCRTPTGAVPTSQAAGALHIPLRHLPSRRPSAPPGSCGSPNLAVNPGQPRFDKP